MPFPSYGEHNGRDFAILLQLPETQFAVHVLGYYVCWHGYAKTVKKMELGLRGVDITIVAMVCWRMPLPSCHRALFRGGDSRGRKVFVSAAGTFYGR